MLSFTHTNGGLVAKGDALKGFVVAGEDKQWKPATARIEGNKVIVSSADVPKPVAARYAWLDNPDCNLFNGAGLPASPLPHRPLAGGRTASAAETQVSSLATTQNPTGKPS